MEVDGNKLSPLESLNDCLLDVLGLQEIKYSTNICHRFFQKLKTLRNSKHKLEGSRNFLPGWIILISLIAFSFFLRERNNQKIEKSRKRNGTTEVRIR